MTSATRARDDDRMNETLPSASTSVPVGEIRVGIAGVRGYKGFETARLVERHPRLRTVLVASDALAGHRLRDLDRDFVRDGGAACVGYNDTLSAARDYGVQLLLRASEREQCATLGEGALEAGIRVVDLSGAHALRAPEVHALTYGFPYPRAASEAAFGLPELGDHDRIRAARLVAIPGAYATTVLLGLLPLTRAGLVEPGSIVVDAKAGTSTAGRKARISLLFSELHGNVYANKIERHQYYPEILQELEASEGPGYRMTLATHLVPIARGVLATSYLRVRDQQDTLHAAERVREVLRRTYTSCPFMQVVERAEDVHVRAVVGTNRGLVGVTPDVWGDRVVVVCATDNLGKGTAGQAIQNANLMLGLPETLGLELGTGGRP